MSGPISESEFPILASGALAEIAEMLEAIARIAVASGGSDQSQASNHDASPHNVRGFTGTPLTKEINLSTMLSTIAGVDHVMSYLDLVASPKRSVSMATLTRGALEGFARAFHVLSADTSHEFLARHINSTLDDLQFPSKLSRFQKFSGEEIDSSAYPEALEEIRLSLGVLRSRVSISHQVRSLLSFGAPSVPLQDLAQIYSQLSGAAHGATSAVGMYLAPSNAAQFEYPPVISHEHVGYMHSAICTVAERYLAVFGLELPIRKEWEDSQERAQAAMLKIA
jgi:hypothetical protein